MILTKKHDSKHICVCIYVCMHTYIHIHKLSIITSSYKARYSNINVTQLKLQAFLTVNINFFFFKFIYLFLAVLGLRFCVRAFSSCGKQGPLFITVHGPLTIAASLVVEHRLQTRRLSSCGSRAQLLRSMWDLPTPGLEPVSPALAGRFSTTAPPGKPNINILRDITQLWADEILVR